MVTKRRKPGARDNTIVRIVRKQPHVASQNGGPGHFRRMPRPFFLPLFTEVRGRGILRSSFAEYWINRSPEAAIRVRILDHAAHSTQHLGGVHKDVLLWMEHHRRRRGSDTQTWHQGR